MDLMFMNDTLMQHLLCTLHPDFKSHAGCDFVFENGKGSPIGVSAKQKLNTGSSATAESVGADQVLPLVSWAPLFMEAQGCPPERNIVCQDNKSAILLEKNGKAGSGKRTRALNIGHF